MAGVSQSPPVAPPTPRPAVRRHGGNWRSLVISMVIMTALVFAFVALMPRPAQRERAAVDDVGKAEQIAAEQSWRAATAAPGEDWKATSALFRPDERGVPTWLVGYHHRPADDVYVTLGQTRPAADDPAAIAQWVVRQTKNGREDGTTSVAGRDWSRRLGHASGSAPDAVFRALVAQDQAAPGGLVTVIAGDTSYEVLERFAGSLRIQQVATG